MDAFVTDAQSTARRSAEIMLASDRATAAMGMALDEVAPGRAAVRMTVREDMLNGWGACHGAMVAAVADTAFAVACNSFGELTVAAGFEISFLAPARWGDQLVASAERRSGAGRTGIYDVTVVRPDEDGPVVVAEFRGRSRSLDRPVEPGARV
jgi:acyl-CoA thioesterase